MGIWNIAVKNKTAVYILTLIIIIMGFFSYVQLPKEAAPDVTIPWIIVSVPYIGVSPTDIEGLVTQPIERAVKGIKDIKEITSVSKEGLSTVRVEFNTGVDIDEALRRVRDKISSIRNQLPNDILEPVISEVNISEFPIMYVNVGGNVGLARLKKIADDLQDKIEAIPGVLRADVNGGLEPEVQVNVDVYRMNAYQISFDDVTNAVRSEHLSIPGGSIDTKEKNLTIRIPGEFKDVKQLENIILKIQNNKPIYLRDVGTVNYSFEDRKTFSRVNQNEVVSVAVRKRAGENLIQIAEDVKAIVKQTQKNLPDGIKLDISNDQSKFIVRMVNELENSIITGMVLVILSLFMFFGLKNSVFISTAIPLSMFIGFIVLNIFGITINMVVLFALVLVLGILVDDAIVVIENIYRHQQSYDESPEIAATKGAGEVFVPVLTATITTLAAFIPLLFWPGIVGDFMKYLPITLIITLSASLFVAYVISPVQAAQWINYKREIKKAKYNLEHPSFIKKNNPFTVIYHKVDEKVFPFLQNEYVKTLKWSLNNKAQTLTFSFGLLTIVIILFSFFNKGVEFFPSTQPSQISVSIEAPPGTSLDITNAIGSLIEERIEKIPGRKDVEFIVSNIGTSQNVFDFGGQGTPNKGTIAINFYEKAKRIQSTFVSLEEIRTATNGIAGADLIIAKQQMGPPVGAPVSVEISGEDYNQLASISKIIKSKIVNIKGLVDLKDDYNTGRPEVEIIVNREKAGLLYTSTGQIAQTVRAAIAGVEAAKYRVGEDEYKIRVRLQENQRFFAADLENLRITFMNKKGQLLSIPLTSVATIKRTTGIADIKRKDQKRVITITGNTEGRVEGDVVKDVKEKIAGLDLPNGYGIKLTGSQTQQEEVKSFLMKALIITLLSIFFIMVAEFNAIKVPFVILISVILSLIGVLFGLLITQTPLSIIMTGVGIIALAGIVVRNGIILLDFVKHQYNKDTMKLDDALLEAGKIRLRPVVLTAVTTVLGLIPMATGFDFDWRAFHFVIGAESADFWRPLAVAIIFGLTISSVLTLIIVPTVYSLLDEWTNKIKAFYNSFFDKD